MSQEQYNQIVKCINFGSPATANELVDALNMVINKLKNYEQKELEDKKNEETKKV